MRIIKTLVSSDGITEKYLQQTTGGHVVETSYFDAEKHIVCLSCQIDCPRQCIFCATGSPVDSVNPILG